MADYRRDPVPMGAGNIAPRLSGKDRQPFYADSEEVPFMPTRSINLTEHHDRFVESGVMSGRFSDASDVVREGLRLLEQREQEDRARIEWLRSATKDGLDDIDSGDYVTLHSGEEIDNLIDQVRQKVTEKRVAATARG